MFVFLSAPSFAQYVESVAEFDFTKPEKLVSDPPISFMYGTLDYRLSDKTLYANDKDVIMSFTDAGNGVVFNYSLEESLTTPGKIDTVFFMQIRTWGEMMVRLGTKGHELVRIEFTGFTGELGNVNTVTKTWYGEDKHASRVTFKNGTTLTAIRKVRVTYLKKAEPLKLIEPVNNASFSGTSLKTLPLYFNQKVTVENPDAAVCYHLDDYGQRDEDAIPLNMTVDSENSNRVILSAVGNVKNGRYEISIPQDVIKTSQGAWNEKITLFYAYEGKLEQPIVAPTPSDVTYFQVPQEVILSFDEPVSLVRDEVTLGLMNEKGDSYRVVLSQEGVNENQVKLLIDPDLELSQEFLMEQGEWKFDIPSGAIKAKSYEQLVSPDIAFTYIVDNTSKLLEELSILKQKSLNGDVAAVGYPKIDSEGRHALNSVLDGKRHSYTEIKNALYSFGQEKDIMLPEDGNWYKIVSVSGNDSLYMRSHNGEMSLLNDVKNASAYKFVIRDGKYNIQTKDGLYLNIVEPSTGAGINMITASDAQNVGLEKFFVENDTIIGLLTLNATEVLFAETVFGKSSSRGFMLVSSNEQANLVKPEFKLSTTVIEQPGVDMLLTVSNVDMVYLMDDYAPYFKKGDTELDLLNPILVRDGDSPCNFIVKTGELKAAGDYDLVIPAGIFKYEKTGYDVSEIEVAEVSVRFTIGNGSTNYDPELPNYNLDYTRYNILQYSTKDVNNMLSTDLNDLIFFAYTDDYTDLVPDPTKTVSIVKYYGKVPVATGHFVTLPNFADSLGIENTKAIILKLDKPFERGSLKYEKGLYCLVIEEATFGDENFGKYIDKNVPLSEKPRPEECRVNPRSETISFYIDDTNADKEYPSNEVLTRAENLLKITGVGYPTEGCPARSSLENKVDTRIGSTDEFLTAINNYYRTAFVTMPPDDGTYYRVSAVSDSTCVYLGYDGEKVFLTADLEMATGFLTKRMGDGTFMFVTGDGKYLRQLSSEPNVSQQASAVNNITLAKFAVEGVEPVKTFGLFSIQAEGSYALADVKDLKMLAASEGLTNFDNVKTNGFKLEAITDNSKIAPPTVKAALDPAHGEYIESLTKVKVTFSGVSKVDLADKTRITLSSATQDNVGNLSIDPVEGKTDEYIITISDLPESMSYTLWIERGAFSYVFAGITREVNSVRANFNIGTSGISGITIDASDEPVYDLQGRKVSGVLKSGIYIKNGKKVYIK